MSDDLENIKETKKKKETFISKLSGEEKEAYYKRLRQNNVKKWAEKRELKKKAAIKAKALLPDLLVEQLLAKQIMEETKGENFQPTLGTIQKLREIVASGTTLAEARKKYFSTLSKSYWEKLTRFLFQDAIPNAEAHGIDIIGSRMKYIRSQKNLIAELEKQNRNIKKEIKELKKNKKDAKADGEQASILAQFEKSLSSANVLYAKNLHQISNIREKVLTMELEVGEGMKKMDLIGDKQKAANVSIHFSTPRPKSDDAVDVTPKDTIRLEDLMKG